MDARECAFPNAERLMSVHKVEQRRLFLRGREFHFVSYEAQPANERRGIPAVPAMWCLMSGAARHPVIPHRKGQSAAELDSELVRWLETEIFQPSDSGNSARLH